MLDDVSSEADIRQTATVAYENLREFDAETVGLPESQWMTLRRDLVDILLKNLNESYWEDRVPTVDLKSYLYAILERAELSDAEIRNTVDAAVGISPESGPTADADGTDHAAGFASPLDVDDLETESDADDGSNDRETDTNASSTQAYASVVDLNDIIDGEEGTGK